MAFIKRKSIPRKVSNQMNSTAGWREKSNMKNARWVSESKDGKLIKFTAPNPDSGKRGEPKTYNSTFNVKTGRWV